MDDIMTNEIIELIKNTSLSDKELLDELSKYHESDIADAIPLLSNIERDIFFKRLPVEFLALLFPYLENVEDYIEDMAPGEAADIIEEMDADDAVDILEEVDEDIAKDIIEEMEDESKEDVELINKYEEDEIGSKLTTNYITIFKGSSIKAAMKSLVSQAAENDNISNLFVVEENNKYYGTILLKDLIIARDSSDLELITKTSYPTLYDTDKVSDVLNEIKDIDLELIPVLSHTNDELIGVITSSDIIETVGEEMGEDYVKLAAITDTEEIDEPFHQSVKKRIPWLALLITLNIFTAAVLVNFESIFSVLPALVLFQSLVLGTTGNAGTQALAVTIRSLADDEINKKNIGRIIRKELSIGLLDGLIIGVIGFTVSFLFLLITKNSVTETGTIISQIKGASIVGLSLLCAIPLSTLAGLLFPLLLKKLHIDPAVASGPLITTLSDMLGIAIYYSVALLLFFEVFSL